MKYFFLQYVLLSLKIDATLEGHDVLMLYPEIFWFSLHTFMFKIVSRNTIKPDDLIFLKRRKYFQLDNMIGK